MEEETRELNFLLLRHIEYITSTFWKDGHPPDWFKSLVANLEQHNLLPQLELPNFNGPPSLVSNFKDMIRYLNVPQEQLCSIIAFARSKYTPPFSTVASSLLSTTNNSIAALGEKTLPQHLLSECSDNTKIHHEVGLDEASISIRVLNECRNRELSGVNLSGCSTTELLSTSISHIQTIIGHKNSVYCVKLDHSEARFFTGSDDCTIKVWSLFNGELLKTLRGHTGEITDMSVSSDDLYLVSSSNDRTMRVWSLRDYSCTKCILVPCSPLVSVTFWNCAQQKDEEQEQNQIQTGALKTTYREKQYNSLLQNAMQQNEETADGINEYNENKDTTITNGESSTEHKLINRVAGQSRKRKRTISDSDFEPEDDNSQQEANLNLFESIGGAFGVPLCTTSPCLAHIIVATDFTGKVFFWDIDTNGNEPLLTLRVSCIENCYCCHPDSRIFSENYETSINRVHAHIGQLNDASNLYIAGGKIVTAWKLYPMITADKKIIIDAKIAFAYSSIIEKTTISFAHHNDAFLVEGIATHGTIVRLKDPANNIPPSYCDLNIASKANITSKASQKKSRMEMCIWDPTDRFVVTAAHDKILRLWDSENGSLLRCFSMHASQLYVLLNVPWIFNEADKHNQAFSDFVDQNAAQPPANSLSPIQQNTSTEAGFYFCSAGYDGTIAIWCSLIDQPLFVLRKSPKNKDFPDVQFTEGVCNRDGTKFIFVTEQSQAIIIGSGCKSSFTFPCEQFFQNDYQPCAQDAEGNIIDSTEQIAPHLLPNGPLLNLHGEPYETYDDAASLDELRYTTVSGYLFIPGSLKLALPPPKQKAMPRHSGALHPDSSEMEFAPSSDNVPQSESHSNSTEHTRNEREARVEAEVRLLREAEAERPDANWSGSRTTGYLEDDDDSDDDYKYVSSDDDDDDGDDDGGDDNESKDEETDGSNFIIGEEELMNHSGTPTNRKNQRTRSNAVTRSTRRTPSAMRRRNSTRNTIGDDVESDEDYFDGTFRDGTFIQREDEDEDEEDYNGNPDDEAFVPNFGKHRKKRKQARAQFRPPHTRARTSSSQYTEVHSSSRRHHQQPKLQQSGQQTEEKRYHTRSAGPLEPVALPEPPPRSVRKALGRHSAQQEKAKEYDELNGSPVAPLAESIDQELHDFEEALQHSSVVQPPSISDSYDEPSSNSPQPPERQSSPPQPVTRGASSPTKRQARPKRHATQGTSSDNDADFAPTATRKQQQRRRQGTKRHRAENENSDDDFVP